VTVNLRSNGAQNWKCCRKFVAYQRETTYLNSGRRQIYFTRILRYPQLAEYVRLANINVTGIYTAFGWRQVGRFPLHRQMVQYRLPYNITSGDAWNRSQHHCNVRSVSQTFGPDTRKGQQVPTGTTFRFKTTSRQEYRLQTRRLATGSISLHGCQQKMQQQQQIGEDNMLINLNEM
jgi:hypothetical protein